MPLIQQVSDGQTIYTEINLSTTGHSRIINPRDDDDRIEYAELNHHMHSGHPKRMPMENAASCPLESIGNSIIVVYIMESHFMCLHYNNYADNLLNLDSLLIQLRCQVTPLWYKFGLAVGITEEALNKYVGYADEECLVEVLDCWLRNHEKKPTWGDVAKALNDIELCQLAEDILNAYKTGTMIIITKQL